MAESKRYKVADVRTTFEQSSPKNDDEYTTGQKTVNTHDVGSLCSKWRRENPLPGKE